MVSVCLPSDAFLQHLPSYFSFSYLGHGVSLHGCSSKAQLLLLTLDEGYLLTAAPPDLKRGVAPLGPPAPAQPLFLVHPMGFDTYILSCIGHYSIIQNSFTALKIPCAPPSHLSFLARNPGKQRSFTIKYPLIC